jgi:catechol 2,3-dioxygenase-like lactoylglutathione lyase family enzyme
MMKIRSFSHTGITVSDFNKAVQFYWDVFGCPLVGVADTPPERVRSFFGVSGAAESRRGLGEGGESGRSPGEAESGRCSGAGEPRCKIGWIRVPGGAVLEIFEFQPQLPARTVPWNGVGLTHISFNVRNLARWHDYLTRKGVECVSRPERSPRGHSFFFARDFDGNLIEMMDLGYMHHVLQWLGPLGGWIFRRGMYRQYYGGTP